MEPVAKLSDLMEPIELQSSEHQYYFDRQTATMLMIGEHIMDAVEQGGELPKLEDWEEEDLEAAQEIVKDKSGRFIIAPDPFEFDEYHHMSRFIQTLKNGRAAEDLARAIKGRGAFRHFKDTLARFGMLDHWYEYRMEAVKEFIINWAEENKVAYVDDLEPRKKAMREQRE